MTLIKNKYNHKAKRKPSYDFIYNLIQTSEHFIKVQEEVRSIESTVVKIHFSNEVIYKFFFKTHTLQFATKRKGRAEPFVNTWLNAFIASNEMNQLADRLQLKNRHIKKWLGASNIRFFFGMWAKVHYPHLFELLYHPKWFKKVNEISKVPLEQFVRFVPEFVIFRLASIMDIKDNMQWVAWLATGQNMRKAPNLPFPLTKKMAHWLMKAPKYSTFDEAFLFGQVRGMGGDENLYELLKNHFRGRLVNYEFRKQIIPFFVRNKAAFSLRESRDALSYLDHIQREGEHFSMKGRTAKALKKQAQEYYDELDRLREQDYIRQEYEYLEEWGELEDEQKLPVIEQWEGADYISYEMKEGAYTYTIKQITTTSEIRAEGGEMLHCVATYARDCAEDQCSIWTLRAHPHKKGNSLDKSKEEMIRLVTIEVDPSRNIVQARGKRNRFPNKKEEAFIKDWADLAQLNVMQF